MSAKKDPTREERDALVRAETMKHIRKMEETFAVIRDRSKTSDAHQSLMGLRGLLVFHVVRIDRFLDGLKR